MSRKKRIIIWLVFSMCVFLLIIILTPENNTFKQNPDAPALARIEFSLGWHMYEGARTLGGRGETFLIDPNSVPFHKEIVFEVPGYLVRIEVNAKAL